VQLAKLRGAGRVVAAARREVTSADAFVSLDGEIAFDDQFDVVIDPLWGPPAAAAIAAMAFRGRLVQLGQSAGGEASLPSADIRFKELEILGHTNFAAPPEVRAEALQAMWGHAATGALHVPCETVPLADAASAWQRMAEAPGVKLVVVP
jgi:NADPH2:quinone reductase